MALESLSEIKSIVSLEELQKFLDSPFQIVRWLTVREIRNLSSEFRKVLFYIINKDIKPFKQIAIETLVKFNTEDVHNYLLDLIKNNDKEISMFAIISLYKLLGFDIINNFDIILNSNNDSVIKEFLDIILTYEVNLSDYSQLEKEIINRVKHLRNYNFNSDLYYSYLEFLIKNGNEYAFNIFIKDFKKKYRYRYTDKIIDTIYNGKDEEKIKKLNKKIISLVFHEFQSNEQVVLYLNENPFFIWWDKIKLQITKKQIKSYLMKFLFLADLFVLIVFFIFISLYFI